MNSVYTLIRKTNNNKRLGLSGSLLLLNSNENTPSRGHRYSREIFSWFLWNETSASVGKTAWLSRNPAPAQTSSFKAILISISLFYFILLIKLMKSAMWISRLSAAVEEGRKVAPKNRQRESPAVSSSDVIFSLLSQSWKFIRDPVLFEVNWRQWRILIDRFVYPPVCTVEFCPFPVSRRKKNPSQLRQYLTVCFVRK